MAIKLTQEEIDQFNRTAAQYAERNGLSIPADDNTVDELPAPSRKDIPEADRLLLELAARALGAVRIEEVDGEGYLNLHFADGTVTYAWNSLLFGDDTLELAVTLGIIIRPFNNHHQGSQVVASVHPYFEEREYAADNAHDLRIATRRAVTRAAAEIERRKTM